MIRGSRIRSGAARLAAATVLAAMLATPALPIGAQDATGGEAVSGAPATPAPLAPGNGAVFASWAETPAFSWAPSPGAEEYQVVINEGERTGPWVSREKWAPGDLGEGTFTWQVQARSQGGLSPLSAPVSFTVSASGAADAPSAEPEVETEAIAEPAADAATTTEAAEVPATEPADTGSTQEATADPAPAAAPAGPTLALDVATPLTVGQPILMTGGGFTPGENVTVRWLGDQGPIMGNATAAEDGSFTFGIAVPETPIGNRPVVAIGDSDGKQAVAWFVIAPSFTVAPAEARPGETVTLTLLGYGPAEPWEVRWGEQAEAAWQSGETDANGTVRMQVTVPEGPAGPVTMAGLGLASGTALNAALSLLEPAAPAAEAAPVEVAASDGATDAAAPADPAIGGATTEGEAVAPPTSVAETTPDPATDPSQSESKPKRERERQEPQPEAQPQPQPQPQTQPETEASAAPDPNEQAREENQLAVANTMREKFGLPPIPPETATAGTESAGAVGEDVSVDATALNGYIDPGASLAGAPDAASSESGTAEELVAAQETELAQYTEGEQIPIPSAVYDLLPNPDAIGAVERTPQDRRDQREDQRAREQERRDREHDGNREKDANGNGDGGNGDNSDVTADPGDSGEPAPAPAPDQPSGSEPQPEPDPALPAPPPGTMLSFIPASDTSTGTDAPDDPQPEIQRSVLPIGGPDSATAFLTFDVSGIGGGKVASATLTITGAIGFWGPVSVTALPGYWADEGSLTWNTAPGGEIQATAADGSPSGYPELPADGVVTTDVTGTVSGDGLVTFVLRGTPDVGQAVGSRESGIPAVLEIVTK